MRKKKKKIVRNEDEVKAQKVKKTGEAGKREGGEGGWEGET